MLLKEGDIISNEFNKPKLTSAQLIKKMIDMGIKFNRISRTQAAHFLSEKNNYMRLASYRKNYDKNLTGLTNKGKYIDLDFSDLVELSTIDMYFRFAVIKMCLDIEHYLKIKLLFDLEHNMQEKGYSIVKQFLYSNEYILKNIERKTNSPYISDLIFKYFDTVFVFDNINNTFNYKIIDVDCPVWALIEIITFGDFIQFYMFYYKVYPPQPIDKNIIYSVKSLRNACAHNNCVIHNLNKGTTIPPHLITEYISKIKTIGRDQRQKKLSSQPIYEFVCLIYLYDDIVPKQIKKYRYTELKELVNKRMIYHSDYFQNQNTLKTSYEFIKKVVDNLK